MVQPATEESVDGFAVAFEKLDERLARALLKVQYELVVAVHNVVPRCLLAAFCAAEPC